MKKNRSALLGLLILALGLSWYSRQAADRPVERTSPVPAKAFINAAWGMSKDEVEKANGLPLERAVSSVRFYKAQPGMDDSRYQTWKSEGQRFLGRPGTVHYTFLNDRLFIFHVFVTDPDGGRLDADMKKYLDEKFGPDFSAEEDDPALKRIWEDSQRIVNYWFYERDASLLGRFKAGYGVLYRPLENPASIDS